MDEQPTAVIYCTDNHTVYGGVPLDGIESRLRRLYERRLTARAECDGRLVGEVWKSDDGWTWWSE